MSVAAEAVPDAATRSRRPYVIAAAAGALLLLILGASLVLVWTTLGSRLDEADSRLAAAESQLARTQGTDLTGIKDDIRAIQVRIGDHSGEITQLRNDMTSKFTALGKNLANVKSTADAMKLCLPEVQAQVNGLSLELFDTNGWVTSGYVSNPTRTNAACHKHLGIGG